MEQSPVVKVSRRAAARILQGHVWVYRSDVVSSASVSAGSLVRVADERNRPLGAALYSSSSQIALRFISRGPVTDLEQMLRQRIRAAVEYRQSFVENSNAYRLVFSEGDGLPGLIVDRYNDVITVQFLTQAMNREDVRRAVIEELGILQPASIIERVDAHIRKLEELLERPSQLLRGEKTSTVFTMNGVKFHHEGLEGQKTGGFLDQRENYAAAARHAHGDALDLFCYQGGFALHLAERCQSVTGVDSSRPSLEVADRNGELNGRSIEWLEANAFDLLRDYSDAKKEYDIVVVDPPAFAKNKRSIETAMRGYKELNVRALKMLRPGGILVTCSCSHHVNREEFTQMLGAAAADARKGLRLIESRSQSVDHPVLPGVPETEYLKCLIAHVNG